MGRKANSLKSFLLKIGIFFQSVKKNMNCLQDCTTCEASDPNISSTHVSVSETTKNINAKTKELANEIKIYITQAVTWLSTTCENT